MSESVDERLQSLGTNFFFLEAQNGAAGIEHFGLPQPDPIGKQELNEDPPDLPLTHYDQKRYDALSVNELMEIDSALLAKCRNYFRKVAMVVGSTMMSPSFRERDPSDTCYAMRVKELVSQGQLESDGNLNYMRYSEVRLRP